MFNRSCARFHSDRLLEIADFVNGYAFKPRHWGREGKPIVKIAELKNGITQKTPRYHGKDIPEKYHIVNGNILFSWSASLDVHIWPHGDALLNQHLFRVIPHTEYSRAFLFHSLKHRMREFRALSLGTTMRHIKRSALSQVKSVIPSQELRLKFDEFIEPIILSILNLTARNANLCRTRDLLLPRLVSGEVDVANLEIAV